MRAFKPYEILITLIACICIVIYTRPSHATVHEYSVDTHTPAHTLSPYMYGVTAIRDKDGTAYAGQYMDAVQANIRPELYDTLAPIVAAIRYAENGTTYQYGVLHDRCPSTYRGQAGWCSATVQKNWDRYLLAGGPSHDIDSYIRYLGTVYCPIGADNDPSGLNAHWVDNVLSIHSSIVNP